MPNVSSPENLWTRSDPCGISSQTPQISQRTTSASADGLSATKPGLETHSVYALKLADREVQHDYWVRAFARFHALRHSREMGVSTVEQFLSWLAVGTKSRGLHTQASASCAAVGLSQRPGRGPASAIGIRASKNSGSSAFGSVSGGSERRALRNRGRCGRPCRPG